MNGSFLGANSCCPLYFFCQHDVIKTENFIRVKKGCRFHQG